MVQLNIYGSVLYSLQIFNKSIWISPFELQDSLNKHGNTAKVLLVWLQYFFRKLHSFFASFVKEVHRDI